MRKLVLIPFLTLLVACGDGNPVQPLDEMSLNPQPSELSVAARSGDAKMVPFKASGTWWGAPEDATAEEIAACEAAGGYVDVGRGVINVTHLGRSQYRIMNCWGEEDILYEEGKIIAANGDELYFTGPGEGGWAIFEVDWGVYPFTYRYSPLNFAGGTGRFEGATGSFMAWGDAYIGDEGWYGSEFWEGEISSVGSSK
jgi:hypothetical protein